MNKTKTCSEETVQSWSPWRQSWGRKSLWWKRFAKEVGFWAGGEIDRELRMVRVVSWQSEKMWQKHEQTGQRQRDWNKVDGENYNPLVPETWTSDQLCVTRMMLVVEQEWRQMNSECCEEVEQRRRYADMKVGWIHTIIRQNHSCGFFYIERWRTFISVSTPNPFAPKFP